MKSLYFLQEINGFAHRKANCENTVSDHTSLFDREEPAASMDAAGKIIVARHSEVQQCNLKTLADGDEVTDGERLQLAMKDMGSCEVYPQSISHNPNGR